MVKDNISLIDNEENTMELIRDNTGLSNVQILIAKRWEELLDGTDLKAIDVHTHMWLWSKGKFVINIF